MNSNTAPCRQADIAARIAAELEAAVLKGHPADKELSRIFRAHPQFGARDRRHYTHVAFAHFRWLGWSRRLAPADPVRQCAWAVILDPASSTEWVARWQAVSGVDAALVERVRSVPLPDKPALLEPLAGASGITCADLFPAWVAGVLPDDHSLTRFAASCLQRPPTWITVPEEDAPRFSTMLEALALQHRLDSRLPGAVAIESPFNLQFLQQKWGGPIHIQDISSQAVGRVCAAKPGQRWWDACAGAGGKTLTLARAVGPSGFILATDQRSSMVQQLVRRAGMFHQEQVSALALDAADASPPGGPFDGVLVDAPCSGLGTWPRNPDARWRTGKEDIGRSQGMQAAILHRAAAMVRPGGVLVYAVCTLARAEGDELTAAFLAKHPSFTPDPFPHPLHGGATPGTVTLHPDEGPGNGMFIARLVLTRDSARG